MIHVCYSLRDESGKYSKFAGTSIQSLLDNTSEEVTIHLIHDSTLSKSNRKKFLKIVYDHEQEIKFYNVEELSKGILESILKTYPNVQNHWAGLAMFYRLVIPNLFPTEISRVIYLDTDILVNLDIAEFWEVDLNGKSIAVVPEYNSGLSIERTQKFSLCQKNLVDPKNYFNSGSILMDLDRLRFSGGRGELFERCIDILKQNPDFKYYDQDALNIIFANDILKLPMKFNCIFNHLGNDLQVESAIYHYCGGGTKPHPDFKNPIQRLWFEYFLKTPFANLDSLGNMWGLFEQIFNGLYQNANFKINLIQRICKFSVNRKRIFITYPQNANRIVELFGLGDGDVVLNAASQSAMNNLIRDAQNDRRIFIFLVDDRFYSTARNKLIELKFIECEDFFDCRPMFMQLPTFHEFIDPISKNF